MCLSPTCLLRLQWSVPIIDSLSWLQQEHESRRDSDEESPRKSRYRNRWARSPHVEDVPAVLLSPVAVSARDPDAIIYYVRIMLLFRLSCRFWLLLWGRWVRSANVSDLVLWWLIPTWLAKWDIPIGDMVECSRVAQKVVSSSPTRGTHA